MNEMKDYKVLKPIGLDGRREVGEIVKLTDEQAKSIGDEYVVLAPTVEGKEGANPDKASKPKKSK